MNKRRLNNYTGGGAFGAGRAGIFNPLHAWPPKTVPMTLLTTVLATMLAALLLTGCGGGGGPDSPKVAGKNPKQRIFQHPLPLKTYASSRRILLRWPRVRGAASYTLYWSRSPEVAQGRNKRIVGIKRTRYTHRKLRNGRPYYYFLAALNRKGEVIHHYKPIGDIPHPYPVRRHGDYITVVPRVHDTFNGLAARYLKDRYKGWVIKEFNAVSSVTPFKALVIPLKPFMPGGVTHKGYRTVPVLAYHHLSRIRFNKMTVQVTDFYLQMAYLKANRYEVITLSQLVDFLEQKAPVPKKAVVITFDDGWRSTYELALPILKKFGYPATLFLYTDLVGSTRQALTWRQVRAVEKSGVIDVQCHSKSHRNLKVRRREKPRAYMKRLKLELLASKRLLQQKIGKRCRYLAYPYGETNHLVAAVAQKNGYRAGFTVDRGANPFFVTNFRILRSMVYGNFTLEKFAANLSTFSDRVMK